MAANAACATSAPSASAPPPIAQIRHVLERRVSRRGSKRVGECGGASDAMRAPGVACPRGSEPRELPTTAAARSRRRRRRHRLPAAAEPPPSPPPSPPPHPPPSLPPPSVIYRSYAEARRAPVLQRRRPSAPLSASPPRVRAALLLVGDRRGGEEAHPRWLCCDHLARLGDAARDRDGSLSHCCCSSPPSRTRTAPTSTTTLCSLVLLPVRRLLLVGHPQDSGVVGNCR